METSLTLREALEKTYRERWAGTRSEKTLMSQATVAATDVADHYLSCFRKPIRDRDDPLLSSVELRWVREGDVRGATTRWYSLGLSPATINKRLNCLSAMGVSVQGCRVKEPKVLKWWLRPEAEREVLAWLAALEDPEDRYTHLDLLIAWTTKTGLRIEETLRLTRGDFSANYGEVTVPGLKTSQAQATLALGQGTADMVARWFGSAEDRGRDGAKRLIPSTYEALQATWGEVREQFGFDNPTATLKALRRSAARYLHYDRGMPLDMVRQYLRHENIETTMGYLRLTGGVSLEEQRRYLG